MKYIIRRSNGDYLGSRRGDWTPLREHAERFELGELRELVIDELDPSTYWENSALDPVDIGWDEEDGSGVPATAELA